MRYSSRTPYAAMTVVSMIGMGSVCDASPSMNSADMSKVTKQQNCAFGHKCADAPDRSTNIWVRGDVLYWNTCLDGFSCQFGDTTIDTSVINGRATTAIAEKDKDIDFEWGAGLRLGLGVDWTCSGWESGAYWTHFHGDGDAHSHHNHADWWLHFDVYEAILGRKFWVGSCVNLKPFTGIRYAQIKQGLSSHLRTDILADTGTSEAKTTLRDKQGLWVLGPELGLEANVYIGRRWSLYGSLAGAILYGHTKASFHDKDAFVLADNICDSSAHSCSNQFALDAGLGLRWEFKYLTLQGGLEHHTYFDYNHIGCCGDLNLYGANLSATVHF